MNNKEFIARAVRGEFKNKRGYSSLLFENNVVYSYGKHYPLLFKIADNWILNDKKCSRTTSKHVGIARQYADFVCELEEAGMYYSGIIIDLSQELVLKNVYNELKRLREKLYKLTPRANKARAEISDRIGQVMKTGFFLESLKPGQQHDQ